MAPRPNQEAFDRALKQYNEAKNSHSSFVSKVEDRYKAYRGIYDKLREAADWTPKLTPPYIQHIVETNLASLVDDKFRYKVRPLPSVEIMSDPDAQAQAKLGVEAHQALMDWQIVQDRFSALQRPFCLQNGIAGMSVAKTYWREEKRTKRRLKPVEEPVTDDNGVPILDQATGRPLTITRLQEETYTATVYDGPTTEVVDVRDFLWHEAAPSLSKARYVCHRTWLTPEEVKEELAAGRYGESRGGWSEKDILEVLGKGSEAKDQFVTREQELFEVDRTKDHVEVVEVWDHVEKKVSTILNGAALLSHKPFPFWHGSDPFTVCTTQPDLFRIPGISQVEKISELQKMLWTLQNQRLANLELINNAIFLFNYDTDDIDLYEFEPGARWPLEDPTQVQMWSPNVIPAEVSLGAEALLKGDLQNLAGGFPFSSGTDSQNVDQKTATGAAIISNIAQRSVNLAKQQLNLAWEDVGDQRLELNQQFIRRETAVPITGEDDETTYLAVLPHILQGDFKFVMEPVTDEMMKQEEQAAATSLMTLAMQLYPITLAAAQAGVGRPLNLEPFIEDMLKAYGKEEVEKYFASAGPPPQALQQGGGPGVGTPAAPDQQTMGITGEGSIDPSVSPSAMVSQSPVTALQRAAAMTGGGQSVPSP